MPEYAESRSLATSVVEVITARFSDVAIEWVGPVGEYHGTIVVLTPNNRSSAPVALLVNFDQSYSLHSGRYVLFEDEETSGTDEERTEQIVSKILEFVDNGIPRDWVDRVFGRRDRVDPWPI